MNGEWDAVLYHYRRDPIPRERWQDVLLGWVMMVGWVALVCLGVPWVFG